MSQISGFLYDYILSNLKQHVRLTAPHMLLYLCIVFLLELASALLCTVIFNCNPTFRDILVCCKMLPPVILVSCMLICISWRHIGMEVRIHSLWTTSRWKITFAPRPLYLREKTIGAPLKRRLGGPRSRRRGFWEEKNITSAGNKRRRAADCNSVHLHAYFVYYLAVR